MAPQEAMSLELVLHVKMKRKAGRNASVSSWKSANESSIIYGMENIWMA